MSALGLSVVDADERTTEQVSIELTHETALGETRRCELDELQGKRAEAIAAARAGKSARLMPRSVALRSCSRSPRRRSSG